jgi:hypothetical protein
MSNQSIIPKTQDDFAYEFRGDTVIILANKEEFSTAELLLIPTDSEGLLDAMSTHAGLMAWLGVAMADAEAVQIFTKDQLKLTEAYQDECVRADALENKEKVTEPQIAARVQLTADVEEAKRAYFGASRKYSILKVVYESFRQRGELIRSIAASLRDERNQPYAGN